MWRNSIALALPAVAIAAFEASAHSTGYNCDVQPCPSGQGWHMGQMMGLGWGQHGVWPGMMGPGWWLQDGAPGALTLPRDLSAGDVEHMLAHQLGWSGNPNQKVGTVDERGVDTIVADIVTKGGSLVQRLDGFGGVA